MSVKKSKKQPKEKMPVVVMAVVGLVGVLLLAAAFNLISDDSKNKQQIKKENIVFSQMENFVNKAKARLEQEIPEGNWKIEKYCEKPSSKGYIEEYNYGCRYMVVSKNHIENLEVLRQVAYGITDNRLEYQHPNEPTTFSIRLNDSQSTNLSERCGFMSWIEKSNRYARVGCFDQALRLRYPLKG